MCVYTETFERDMIKIEKLGIEQTSKYKCCKRNLVKVIKSQNRTPGFLLNIQGFLSETLLPPTNCQSQNLTPDWFQPMTTYQ